MKTIEDETTSDDGEEIFSKLQSLSVNPIKEKHNIKYIDKDKRKKLDEFITEIRVLDLDSIEEIFGETHARSINSLKKKARDKELIEIKTTDDERLSGLNTEERDVAEGVFAAHAIKKDFKDALSYADKAQRYSFHDVLSILTKLGRQFATKLGSINPNNYITIMEDLRYDEEKDVEEVKKTIKELVASIKKDIPLIREWLKEEAENKIQEVVDNPATYLEKETRGQVKTRKTKGKTTLKNLLVKRKLIVEDN